MRWKYWLPGLLLAGIGGFGLLACFVVAGSFGFGLTIALPFSIGGVLGYGVRVRKFLIVIIVLALLFSLVIGLISSDLAGILCGAIIAGIFVGPLMIGTFFGWLLRVRLRSSSFNQRGYLPMIALLTLPLCAMGLEYLIGFSGQIETVSTSTVLPMRAQDAWDCLMFYEQVKATPPALVCVALPQPLNSRGTLRAVGDTRTCVYDRGRLLKRVTEYMPNQVLGFEVIEQKGIEDRSVQLIGGSFRFSPLSGRCTRVTLSTHYRPLLSARVIWRPFERAVARAMHQHVLSGIETEFTYRQRISTLITAP